MIQMGTILDVADNSGAKKIACIHLRGGNAGQYGRLGDVITASVKEATPDGTVKKGAVVKAVIVRTVKEQRRRDGSYIRFDTERRGADQRQQGADRHARLRPGGARAAREALHEDRLAGAGSDLRNANDQGEDQEERPGAGDGGQGPRRQGQGAAGASRPRARRWSSAST